MLDKLLPTDPLDEGIFVLEEIEESKPWTEERLAPKRMTEQD